METTNKNAKKENVSNLEISNLGNVKKKISLKKESLELIEKEGKDSLKGTSRKSIYKGFESLSTDEKKTFRGKIRRDLNNFVKEILGKGRSNSEREKAIEEFMEFYKMHWRITDFRIENFSQKTNEGDIKDYKNLLKVVSQSFE